MTGDSSSVVFKGVLTIGFLAFTGALVSAYTTPATGYELSIYRSTPPSFWIGIGLAFFLAVTALFASGSRRMRDAGGLLAGGSLLAVVGLPLFRSYAYYGSGDSLSHLGWAREIQTGVLGPDGILYPANHLIGIELAALSGLDLTATLPFVPGLLFPLVYLVSMVLCVSLLTDSRWAMPVGLFAAVLLIPINKISVHVLVHPSSQAILFLPFVLYLLFRYLRSNEGGFPLATPMGIPFLLAAVGLLFVHPQETMTFVSMLVAIVGLQVLVRQFAPEHPIASHRPVGVHTVVIGLIFVAWIVQHDRAIGRVESAVSSLLTVGATAGGGTDARAVSLVQLGGSVEELFVKLFAVSVVFSLLAGGLILLNLTGKLDPARAWRNAAVTYLTVALIPASLLFLAVFVTNQGDHYFRFHGFIMAVVTIVGAVGLVGLLGWLERRSGSWNAPVAWSQVLGIVVVVLMLLLAAQLLGVHQSPYIYQSNQQVTDAELSGHDIVFEHHDGETTLTGVRKGQRRHIDAHYGWNTARTELNFPGYRTGIPGEVFNTNLTTHFSDDVYVVIGDRNEQQELELYDELRYSRAGFERLETDHRINRVQDNGGIRLYRIQGS